MTTRAAQAAAAIIANICLNISTPFCVACCRTRRLAAAGSMREGGLSEVAPLHWQHYNLAADLRAPIEINHVVIEHADAAARNPLTDRVRCVGSVNAVDGAAEIHGACAERIAGTASHKTWQIGLALQHLCRRRPVRPFGLTFDR